MAQLQKIEDLKGVWHVWDQKKRKDKEYVLKDEVIRLLQKHAEAYLNEIVKDEACFKKGQCDLSSFEKLYAFHSAQMKAIVKLTDSPKFKELKVKCKP